MSILNYNTSLHPVIVMFDSGIGGIYIYKKIKKIFPYINYIYIFDNAAFPYSEKKEKFIINRVLKIINRINHLKMISLLIIACNTAGTIVLPYLRKKFLFPVIGVVPEIKSAVNITSNKIIGLLATHGTIARLYTKRLIEKFKDTCTINMIGSTELVELVEKKILGIYISIQKIKNIIEPWLSMKNYPDTIILGCTHFLFLKKELKKFFSKKIVFVDSSHSILNYLHHFVKEKNFLNNIYPDIAYSTKKITEKDLKLILFLKHVGFNYIKKLNLKNNVTF